MTPDTQAAPLSAEELAGYRELVKDGEPSLSRAFHKKILGTIRHWKARAEAAESALKEAQAPDEHGETPETYEEIGRVFMDEYRLAMDHPVCADYVCCDGPSEIISHLLNKIEETEAQAKASPPLTLTHEERSAAKLAENFMLNEDADELEEDELHKICWALIAIGDRLTPQDVSAAKGEGVSSAPEVETGAPDGWKLVPREPTHEMWAAMGDALVGYKQRHHDKVAEELWQAVYDAAPADTAQERK